MSGKKRKKIGQVISCPSGDAVIYYLPVFVSLPTQAYLVMVFSFLSAVIPADTLPRIRLTLRCHVMP
jgi:hypothetical protein